VVADTAAHAEHWICTPHQRSRYPITEPDPMYCGEVHVAVAFLAMGNDTVSARACVGTPAITAADLGDVLDLELPLVAFTLNLFGVPLVSPTTVHASGVTGIVRVHVHVLPPGDAVTS